MFTKIALFLMTAVFSAYVVAPSVLEAKGKSHEYSVEKKKKKKHKNSDYSVDKKKKKKHKNQSAPPAKPKGCGCGGK